MNKNIFHLYDHFVHMDQAMVHVDHERVPMKKKIFQMNGEHVHLKNRHFGVADGFSYALPHHFAMT
jgi:hypothetical protein